MIGTPVRSAAETKPPRPNRCSLYRSANGLPIPLNPSGHTPTSSSALSRRSASALHASVVPCLRPSGPTTGSSNTRSAPSIRRCRCAGWSSCSATEVISASSGTVPEWLATTSAPPSSGTWSQAGGLDPEPRPVERPQQREKHVVGEVGVEAEVVDGVVAGQAAAQEGERVGERGFPFGRERSGVALCGLDGGAGRRRLGSRLRHRPDRLVTRSASRPARFGTRAGAAWTGRRRRARRLRSVQRDDPGAVGLGGAAVVAGHGRLPSPASSRAAA